MAGMEGRRQSIATVLSPPTPVAPPPGSPDGTASGSGAPIPGLPSAIAGSDASSLIEPPTATARPVRSSARRTKPRPVFVISLARSGSTLLRYLLDSHPEISSPPELNLSALLQHVVDVWTRTNEARGVVTPADAAVPPDVRRRACRVVDEIMTEYASDSGASVFCDKSLTTVDHLPVVSQCYPRASFVFLYRYPLDFIASGIEACQWGYNAYGFAPYVAGNVANFVSGLGSYWIDRVTKMVEFERTCTVAHARLYYELLCDDPLATLTNLLKFLDLDCDDSLVERAFDTEHGHGPGDYKIDFTRSISADSVGRGATIPQLLGPGQVARINDLLAELDYPALESGWRGDLAGLLGLKSAKQSSGTARVVAERIVSALSGRAQPALAKTHQSQLPMDVWIHTGTGDDAYLLVGTDGTIMLAEQPDLAKPNGRPRIRCTGDVLLQVLSRHVTFGQAIHDGRVRFEPEPGSPPSEPRPRRALAALAAVFTPAGNA